MYKLRKRILRKGVQLTLHCNQALINNITHRERRMPLTHLSGSKLHDDQRATASLKIPERNWILEGWSALDCITTQLTWLPVTCLIHIQKLESDKSLSVMALAPLSQDKAHIPKNISFDLRLQAVDAWSSSAAPALLREPVWRPFPLFSLFSDSERGNWLAWLRRVGDWQPLTSNHSDNERGGKQRDVASDATSVCLCYRGGTVHVWPHVHVLRVHACMHSARLQIPNYKSVWNCLCIICVFLPRDPSSLQLAWPQGYAALSFSVALHLWQISSTCAAYSLHAARHGALRLAWALELVADAMSLRWLWGSFH